MNYGPSSLPDPLPTRYSLLSRLHDWDDQDSWRSFFDTYWRLIYHIALKSGLTDSEAHDVVQETIMCVARDIGKFRRQPELGSFKGWLRNIIRWRVADQLRWRGTKRGQNPEIPAMDYLTVNELPQPDSPLERLWETEWQQNLLHTAVNEVKLEVKAEHFQVFDLLVMQEIPLGEVTSRLGVNRAQAYLIKHRLLNLVKKKIRALEATHA